MSCDAQVLRFKEAASLAGSLSLAVSLPTMRFLSALVPAKMSGTKQRQKDARLCGLPNADHRDGGAETEPSAVIGGDWLVVTWMRMEEVAAFIVASTEPGRRPGTFEPAHGLVSAFDAAVILLQPVVEVAAGPMAPVSAQLLPATSRRLVLARECLECTLLRPQPLAATCPLRRLWKARCGGRDGRRAVGAQLR